MARTIWDWLEIEATKDKRLIKKAYAEQSKKYHPEDVPEEAKQLRNAYKMALAYAESDIKKQTFPQGVQAGSSENGLKASSGSADDEDQFDLNGQQGKADGLQTKVDTEQSQNSDKIYRYSTLENDPTYISFNDGISYKFPVHRFKADREDRLRKLLTRFNNIYTNLSYYNNVNMWLEAIKNCLVTEDLEDVYVVAEVISILEQMPDLSPPVWHGLELALFRYSVDNSEWQWLKSQFIKAQAREVESKSQGVTITVNLKTLVLYILIILAFFGVIILLLILCVMGYEDEALKLFGICIISCFVHHTSKK